MDEGSRYLLKHSIYTV